MVRSGPRCTPSHPRRGARRVGGGTRAFLLCSARRSRIAPPPSALLLVASSSTLERLVVVPGRDGDGHLALRAAPLHLDLRRSVARSESPLPRNPSCRRRSAGGEAGRRVRVSSWVGYNRDTLRRVSRYRLGGWRGPTIPYDLVRSRQISSEPHYPPDLHRVSMYRRWENRCLNYTLPGSIPESRPRSRAL